MGKIVKEEEGLSSPSKDIIHTHGNQVLTNCVMLIAQLGHLQ